MDGGIAACVTGNSKIIKSYNIGYIHSRETGSSYTSLCMSGGIIGYTQGNATTIENCYNIGETYGMTHVGGIIGHISSSGSVIINNCYTMGRITGNNRYAIVGIHNSTPAIMSNNYWLTNCGAISGSYSNGNANATPLNEEEIKGLALTLSDSYTNDEKTKIIDEETGEEKEVWKYNNGYPILKWQLR
ncbi:MAG: hypothetical protein HFJ57_03680 [Clostridia bacterium]|nr:hypothetical protein [Clostridia bacterium]